VAESGKEIKNLLKKPSKEINMNGYEREEFHYQKVYNFIYCNILKM
jgi:hypothetical protein